MIDFYKIGLKLEQENLKITKKTNELKKENKKLKKDFKRVETLLFDVCYYLTELLDKDDLTARHSAIRFGMTPKEHKKYILGE